MKKLIFCAVVFLSGCANFDAERFNQAFNQSLQQYQQNQQLIQSMQPRPMQSPSLKAPELKSGLTWSLKGNTVNGTIRYCTYSNGEIISIHVTQWCDNTIIR